MFAERINCLKRNQSYFVDHSSKRRRIFIFCLYSNCICIQVCFCICASNHCIICPVEQGDNDQFENHNGEFTEKKCVRGRLDWIRFLPHQPQPSPILKQKYNCRLYHRIRKMILIIIAISTMMIIIITFE